MKLLVGVAVATFMLSGAAFAQTPPAEAELSANCTGFSPPPSAPDGATARASAMTAAAASYETWLAATQEKQRLCQADVRALELRAQANVEAYNRFSRGVETASADWAREVEEYNARGGSRRRERGGVMTTPDQ